MARKAQKPDLVPLSPDEIDAITEGLAAGLSLKAACGAAGLSVARVRSLLDNDPTLRERIDIGEGQGLALIQGKIIASDDARVMMQYARAVHPGEMGAGAEEEGPRKILVSFVAAPLPPGTIDEHGNVIDVSFSATEDREMLALDDE